MTNIIYLFTITVDYYKKYIYQPVSRIAVAIASDSGYIYIQYYTHTVYIVMYIHLMFAFQRAHGQRSHGLIILHILQYISKEDILFCISDLGLLN